MDNARKPYRPMLAWRASIRPAGLVALFLACAALAACGGSGVKFAGTDITGADYGKHFALTDHRGRPRRLEDFRGKVATLFFGYTQCPDVCPTNLSTMARVMKLLGHDAERVQVLFVTVDPERDTPAVLSQYVPSFYPDFLGLYGDAATTARTAQEFKVFYQKVPGKTPTRYTVDHTAGTYVFDPKGRLRLYFRYGEQAPAIAADIRLLLAGK
jgi:protein SCO1